MEKNYGAKYKATYQLTHNMYIVKIICKYKEKPLYCTEGGGENELSENEKDAYRFETKDEAQNFIVETLSPLIIRFCMHKFIDHIQVINTEKKKLNLQKITIPKY